MATLIYKSTSGESIELGNVKPIILEKIEGFTSSKNSINTSKLMNNDGEKVVNESLEMKDMSIQLAIIAEGEEFEKIKEKIISIFNPKIAGTIIYINSLFERSINVKIESTPNFSKGSMKKIQRCVIDFVAPSPNFESYELSELISTWIGGWKFKFRLPFRFKQKGEPKKNIYNEGHIETPVEIIFKGPAVNPKILNCRTGEFMKVDRVLTSDDTLYITTEFGNKKVEIERNGVRQNAFHYIDLDSTFFQLKTGDNMIEYSTDNELDPQSVEIRYRNRYLGV